MATSSMRMVDATAASALREARYGTACLRFGKVTVAPAAGQVTVLVGGASVPCNYLVGSTLVVNDWVCVANERDVWLVLGKVAP